MMRRLCVALFLGIASASARAQVPPDAFSPQAAAARHTHGSVDIVALGEGIERVYAFLPAEPALPPGPVPLVLFHHGWQGMNPKNYGALLDHLAREGNVVLFPVYQDADSTSPQIVAGEAARAERAMLAELAHRGYLPDPPRVLYWGYSMGSAISLKLATTAETLHLPAPQALVLTAPGDALHVAKGDAARSIWPVLTDLPPALPVAVVTGEDDRFIGLPSAQKLASLLCSTLPDRRVVLVLPGDEHAGKKIGSGHAAPGAPDSRYDISLETPAAGVPKHIAGREGFEPSASLNNLDFYGFWRVTDALLDSLAAAAHGTPWRPPATVFGSGPGRLALGTWPDGTRYKPAHTEPVCSRTR